MKLVIIISMFLASIFWANETKETIELQKKLFCDSYRKISAVKKAESNLSFTTVQRFFGFNKHKDVGYITYDFDKNNSKNNGYIHHLYVNEECRKSGIGTLLFKEALKDLKDQGLEKVYWCSTNTAIPFYLKNGAVHCKKNKSLGAYPMKIRLREHTFKEKFSKFVKHCGQHFHKNDLFE